MEKKQPLAQLKGSTSESDMHPEPATATIARHSIEVSGTPDIDRPALLRSSPADGTSGISVHPDAAYAGGWSDTTMSKPPAARRRSDAAGVELPPYNAPISRSWGLVAMESSGTGPSSGTGRAAPQSRSTTPPGSLTGNAQNQRLAAVQIAHVAAPQEDSKETATPVLKKVKTAVETKEATAPIALDRGVSLATLKICATSQLQEDAIKSVMSVVGSRQKCSNEKGTFQFKGTQRVSSFNLIVFPNRGREPSHRCEELDYAYTCLKKN
jgi:hypothetical protein